MLFNPRPKCSRSELFDREEELEELHRAVGEGQPLILLTGIRRIGKTSVLCVLLNELNLPYILIDGRSLPPNYGVRDLYEQLARSMSNPRFLQRMRSVLERVRGVRIVGFEVELTWRGREAVSLTALFDSLNRERVIVAVDEAQKLRGPRGRIFLEALAHAYDYNRNITFILTGSEVGLLYDYLGVDNPSSPMYGRYLVQLSLRRFTREESLEFLEKGFREAGFNPPKSYLEEIVEAVDGIPGWLTLAGNYIAARRKLIDVEEVKRQAVNMAARELEELGKTHGPRILRVLKLLAEGYNSWTRLKKKLEEIEGRTVSKSSLSRILHTLEKLSIIENYSFLDPIYREAAKQLTTHQKG